MRFRRRSDEPAAQPVEAGAAVEPVGAVDAAFAAVLDGRHLWLAVRGGAGRFALRSAEGRVVDLPAVDDSHDGHLSARLDLGGLPDVPGAHDVVLVGPDGARWVHGEPGGRRTPVAPGGAVRHRLVRTDDGALRLRTEQVVPAASLVAVSAGPDVVRLTTDPAGPVHLLGEDGVLASWPSGEIDDEAVDGLGPQVARVVVGDGHLPVRRRDDDLADPARGAPLPAVGRLRLRWSPRGLLQARVLEPGEDA